MSFSKARIQRFNELPSEAPPPGAYDPKFDVKVKRSVIEKKTGRFNNDARSTSSAECSASVSSRSTGNASAKKFRTPQVPKKKIIAKPRSATICAFRQINGKKKDEQQQQATYEPQQELADLKVECDNKDKTIREYEKDIEEMKTEIRELREKYDCLQIKYDEREKQHEKDIESMFQLPCALLGHQVEIGFENDNDETIKAEIANLENELSNYKEQADLVDQMVKLEAATKELDKMTEEFNEALNLKDQQMTDLLKLQTETECKLDNVKIELNKSKKQVTDLQTDLETMNKSNVTADVIMNRQSIEKMINFLQKYFDYDNSDGKWNIEDEKFLPDVKQFLNKIKQFADDLKINFEREIELSRDNFNEERENLEQELDLKKALVMDLENKLAESNETNNYLTKELKDVQKLYKDANRNLREIKSELEAANEKYEEAVKAHKAEMEVVKSINLEENMKLNDLLRETKKNYLKELDNITLARNRELAEARQSMEKRIEDEKKRTKDCANKMIENAEAVTRETLSACRAESEERIKRVIAETEAKINQMKKASKEELQLTMDAYNERFDKLENEKTSLNTDVAQRDLEIIELNAALDEMKRTVETQESFSQSLQDELDRVEAELVEKKDELRNLKDQIRNESSEMVARKRRLELVMAENQASVAALSCRLAQSENEVERLLGELEIKESTIDYCRELLSNMSHDSKIVREQLDTINEDIDKKFELVNQIETRCVNDINNAKTMFSDKIDNLKSITIDELKRYQIECKTKSERNTELKVSLKQMSDKLGEATDMLLKMEEINDEQSIELSKLQLQNTKLQQQLDEKNRVIEEIKFINDKDAQRWNDETKGLKEQISRLKFDLRELETKNSKLEEKKYDNEELKHKYEDKAGIMRTNLENERTQREKLERQLKQYENTIEHLTDECKRITEKYSEVIGHTNHKQRIKHVSQLKEKINSQQIDILRLRQELDTKNNTIDELRQTNDKLKNDERRQYGIGKENIHNVVLSSPHKTLFQKSANTTPASSPLKPLTPLRDRNE